MSDWRSATLGELVDVLDAQRRPVNSEERSVRIGDVPYYGANGQQGWIDGSLFDEPLILMAEDGGNFDDFHTRPIAYRIDGPSWVNNHAHIIRSQRGTCQDFLFWSLVHRDIRRYISGGTRTKLTQAEMRAIELKVPDIIEQRRIAEILDTLDDQIRSTGRIVMKHEDVRESLVNVLVSRAISMANDGVQGWRTEHLGVLVREYGGFIQTGPFGSQLHSYDYVRDGVPVVMPQDINGGRITLDAIAHVSESTAGALNRHRMHPGDIVLARRGNLERCAEISAREGGWLCGTGCLLVRPPAKILRASWLALVYRHEVGQRHVRERGRVHHGQSERSDSG
jgi:type I restriction enzyme S subunit